MKVCIDCGAYSQGYRCLRCTAALRKQRRNPIRDTGLVRRATRQAVRLHVQRYGYWCPGYNRPPHPAQDLTADHPVALVNGGHPTEGLAVLCGTCNRQKGSRSPGAYEKTPVAR